VLWFGETLYEGLGGGYTMVHEVIRDTDGDVMPYRLRVDSEAEEEDNSTSQQPKKSKQSPSKVLRTRKLSGDSTEQTKKRVGGKTRKSGHAFFVQDFRKSFRAKHDSAFKGNEFVKAMRKEAKDAWCELSAESKEEYNRRAEAHEAAAPWKKKRQVAGADEEMKPNSDGAGEEEEQECPSQQ